MKSLPDSEYLETAVPKTLQVTRRSFNKVSEMLEILKRLLTIKSSGSDPKETGNNITDFLECLKMRVCIPFATKSSKNGPGRGNLTIANVLLSDPEARSEALGNLSDIHE